MRAIVHEHYGSPDLLRLAEVEMPTMADDQALVRVRASSVNSGDWRRVRGAPFVIRFGEGLRRPKSGALGADAAGVVEAVGRDVTDLAPGDEVYGIRLGAYAEYVSGSNFARKPANLTFEQAAAVPIAGCTALQALRDHGKVTTGQRVLVNGAGGGVGTFAVQIAKAFGADVTAVTRTENLELVGSIGADRLIDYTREDFTRPEQPYDVVIDVGGNRPFGEILRALTPTGRLVVVGAGKGHFKPLARLLGGSIRARSSKQPIAVFIANVNKEDLTALRELIEAGKVTPVIDRTYPLAEIAAAIGYVETEKARGKVVITI